MKADNRLPTINRDEALTILRRCWRRDHPTKPGDVDQAQDDRVMLEEGVDDLVDRGTHILIADGNRMKAFTYLNASIMLRPTSEAYFGRATASTDLGHPQAALHDIDDYIERNANDPCAHALRGMDLRLLGRFDEALEAFGRALELDENHFSSRFERGACLLQVGRPQKALNDFDRLLHYVDLDDEYWSARAAAYTALGMQEDADECTRRAAKVRNTPKTWF